MNSDTLWLTYIQRNPHWVTEGAHLTPRGLEKLVKAAYEVGYKQGRLDRSAPRMEVNDLFGSIFENKGR